MSEALLDIEISIDEFGVDYKINYRFFHCIVIDKHNMGSYLVGKIFEPMHLFLSETELLSVIYTIDLTFYVLASKHKDYAF